MIVPSLSPGVVVSTGVFHSNFVPGGSSGTLPIPSSAAGVPPTGVVISLQLVRTCPHPLDFLLL
ncbi:hypothetical protein [Ligilactobacillus animalis]